MSGADRFDAVMRLALADVRDLEPAPAEIQAAVRRARSEPAPRRRARTRLIAGAAALSLLAGTAAAVPQSREAIVDGFEAFRDFLSGGDPPGTPVPSTEPAGRLNWFGGSDVATGSVIAEARPVRLIAYRDPTTGEACLGYGLATEECRPDTAWSQELARSAVLVRGPLPEPDAGGRLPLVGITADRVTTIEILYADGSGERADGVEHGFVLYASPTLEPTTLVARDSVGTEVARLDISGRPWSFSP